MLHVLSDYPSVLSQFLLELRDTSIHTDRWRFRRNIERMGEVFAYEISRKLEFEMLSVQTPLGIAEGFSLTKQPVIATVLRAGLPLQTGLLNFFDRADAAYITAYRTGESKKGVTVNLQYVATPNLSGRTLILADTMLATGTSLVLAYEEIVKISVPSSVHIVSVIASRQGLEHVQKNIPNADFWIGAIDEKLNAKQYIVPGLGDAGDLSFGEKL
jgi:uracil phosphoribosyltransferase